MKVIVRFSGLSGAAVALLMVGLIVVAGGLGPHAPMPAPHPVPAPLGS